MRLLHTSDWHLGRSLHGANLIDDQAHLLKQFVDLAKQEKPDAVLVAGDIFDRAVPPTEAVDLLDEVISRLVLDLKLQVIVIAGNHDSASRLAFGSRLLAGGGLHILGSPCPTTSSLVVQDKHGPVHFYPLPYAEPAIVRHFTEHEDVQSHQAAMKVLLDGIWLRHPKGARSLAMAHCFVTGSSACESERPISIGGASSIDATIFANFNYVALGHLHRPQACNGGRLRYSGSLMRYSFSETDHDKAVLLIEMDAKGDCDVKDVRLSLRRQVRQIEGKFNDVLADAASDTARDDYLKVTLLDQEPIFDAMGKLRMVYPNILHIERPAVTSISASGGARVDHRKMDEPQLFAAFVKQVTGDDLTEGQAAAFANVVEQVRRAQRGELA